MAIIKWHKWPEALYCVQYCYEPAVGYRDPETDEATESITVDAHTFLEVEDFAKATCPKDWVVATIEKTYLYAEMYGGAEGGWIDVQLTDGKATCFTEVNELNEGTYNFDILTKRKTFLKRIEAKSKATA
jgi:hypothetical protein